MSAETYVLKRIEMIQEELEHLKKIVQKGATEQPVSLRGLWHGVDFTDEQIEEAQRSLFREAYRDPR